MGIYLPNMEMPKNCEECDLSKTRRSSLGDIIDCKYIGTVGSAFKDQYSILNARHPKCPLVEVPTPHGRLIDTDELYGAIVDKGQRNERGKYRIGDFWELNGCEIREVIDRQPTIIEAEGNKE